MLLTVRTLPQLAVSAKLLCLLMVVICGAVPSMVRSVRLYNDCSSSEVRVDMEGRVFADDDQTDKSHKLKNLTIRSLDFSVKLTIFAVEAQRYLCFNKKWKLVGSKKFKGEMCEFYEDMEKNGYNRYRSVANESHFVGFNRRGKPLRGGQSRQRSKCLNFLKFDTEFSINSHNQRIAGGNFTAEVPAHAHQQLLKNKQQKTSFVNSNNNSTTALISHKRGNKNKQQNRKNSVRQRFRHEKHHRNGKRTS